MKGFLSDFAKGILMLMVILLSVGILIVIGGKFLSYVHSFFTSNPNNLITIISLSLLFLLCSVLTISYFKNEKKYPNKERIEPQLIIASGVLCTFIGVVYSLMRFDTGDINNSIKIFLDGMKFAFISSVIGMGWGNVLSYRKNTADNKIVNKDELLFRFLADIKKENNDTLEIMKDIKYILQSSQQTNKDTNNLEQMIQFLKDIKTLSESNNIVLRHIFAENNSKLDSINESILENNNQLLKVDASNKELCLKFDNFAENMAENNNAAFIKALEESIKNLNEKLTVQLGDNFKSLDNSIGKMLDWQIKYKELVEKNNSIHSAYIERIKSMSTDLENMANNSLIISDEANKLRDFTYDSLDILKTYKEITDSIIITSYRAKEVLPQLEEYIDAVKEYNECSEDILNNHENIIEKINKSIELFSKHYEECNNKTNNIIDSTSEKINDLFREQIKNYEKVLNEHINLLSEVSNRLEQEGNRITIETSEDIRKLSEQLSSSLEQHVANININLDKQLSESLNSLGTALTTISSKFTQDYGELAEKIKEMSEVVNMIQLARRKQ